MNSIYSKIGAGLFGVLILASCQDKDLPGSADMLVDAPDISQITGQLTGENKYDYTLTWPENASGAITQVAVYKNGTQQQALTDCPDNTFTLQNLETNQLYEFLYKNSLDGNLSKGVMNSYTRLGATSVQNVKGTQIDISDDEHQLKITWSPSADATSYVVTMTSSDGKNISIETQDTTYLITDAQMKQSWDITVIAQNADGKALPSTGSARVGGKIPAFLSEYATPEELIANGDDDEASAWLWFHETYPKGDYLYFGNITKYDDVQDYRMLFWLRDKETGNTDDVWTFSDAATDAAPVIAQYVKNGGNLLLWSHAVPYIGTIGRVKTSDLKSADPSIGCGAGGWNGDTWKMGVCLNTGSFYKDLSTHAIYAGLTTEKLSDACPVGIAMKGPGWTEDHNCLFFNLPAKWTEKENTTQECYTICTEEYGIYPLGTWDSQTSWVSQLNVWEAKGAEKAPTGYQKGCGSILCIGNGGCEFSMKNADGTPDKSAHPSVNSYQDNILKLAKNAIDYLMSI